MLTLHHDLQQGNLHSTGHPQSIGGKSSNVDFHNRSLYTGAGKQLSVKPTAIESVCDNNILQIYLG